MLKSISVNNIKVIRNIEEPLTLSNLSEVNYLIGKNGSGKSTILDALQSIHSLTNLTSASKDTNSKRFSVLPRYTVSSKSYFITFLSSPLIKLYNLDYYIELEFETSVYIYSHISQIDKLIPKKFTFISDFFEELLFYAPLIERGSVLFSGINDQIEKHKNQDSYKELVSKINFILKEFGFDDSIILKNEQYYFHNSQDKVSFALLSTGIKHFYELLQFVENQVKEVVKYNKIPQYLDKVNICFLIDEFEAFFHPSIQKKIPKMIISVFEQKLYEDLKNDFKIKQKIQFIICTHSPFVLNSAINEQKSSIFHLKSGKVNTKYLSTYSLVNDIINDIGCKPSDLLISNGIIWVEGPSDIVLIEEWLKIFQNQKTDNLYKRGVHYDYAIYGGSLLKYYHLHSNSYINNNDTNLEIDTESQKILNILTINPNFFIVFDNDMKSNLKAFNKAKEKLIEKIKNYNNSQTLNLIWYEQNIEICTIEHYFKVNNQYSYFFSPQKRNNKHPIFKNISKDLSRKYSTSKAMNSLAIIYYWNHIIKQSPTFEDFEPELKERITNLYKVIKSWNTL